MANRCMHICCIFPFFTPPPLFPVVLPSLQSPSSTYISYTSLASILKTSPFPIRWIETSTLSLPAFLLPPHHHHPTTPRLWLSQRGVLSQGQKGEVGSDLWLREGRRERGRDQSNAFKLLIISIKALQDINPVRLLMCIGFWARLNYDGEEWVTIQRRGISRDIYSRHTEAHTHTQTHLHWVAVVAI